MAKRQVVEATTGSAVEAIGSATHANLYRVRHGMRGAHPLVSVIIPSRDNPSMLATAVRSVATSGYAAAEIVIVDNGSVSVAQRALLAELAQAPAIRIVYEPGPFNFSRLINCGRAAGKGDVLLLLNDDVEALASGWLEELAANAVRPEIGCVGALLLYPDGRVRHAGIVLGSTAEPATPCDTRPVRATAWVFASRLRVRCRP